MGDTVASSTKASAVPAWIVAVVAILSMAVTGGIAIAQTRQNSQDIQSIRSDMSRRDVEDVRWEVVQSELTDIKGQIKELADLKK